MIPTKSASQHEVMKEIVSLTMQLKTRHPNLYEHLDETPVFKSSDPVMELKEMEDYRNTLSTQLKVGDAQIAGNKN